MTPIRHDLLDAISDERLSASALAGRLDLSAAAVREHVAALREEGFVIDGGYDGYELVSVPEFGGEAVAYGLDAPYDVEFHERIPSTNDRARHLAERGESDVVVLADEQTGGKGRLDRSWESPSGGVYLSVVLRPSMDPADAPVVTLAAAVATVRAAREAGVDAAIKWPNDVLVPGRGGDRGKGDEQKLAGILTEMEGSGADVSWLVVGIGVNADIDPEALPDESATSLSEQAGEVNRRRFTKRLLEEFDALLADPEAVVPAWREHATTLGRRVRVETPEGAVTGTATDIEFPGTLIVDTGETRERVAAGDCEHLRPVE